MFNKYQNDVLNDKAVFILQVSLKRDENSLEKFLVREE